MMEQWLIEGNFSHNTILMLSIDLMSAGVDSVNLDALCIVKCLLSLHVLAAGNKHKSGWISFFFTFYTPSVF